jgi:hypothetical protein
LYLLVRHYANHTSHRRTPGRERCETRIETSPDMASALSSGLEHHRGLLDHAVMSICRTSCGTCHNTRFRKIRDPASSCAFARVCDQQTRMLTKACEATMLLHTINDTRLIFEVLILQFIYHTTEDIYTPNTSLSPQAASPQRRQHLFSGSTV